MPHYKSYDSFKFRKGIEAKEKIKNKKLKKEYDISNFIVDEDTKFGIVLDVDYNYAHILYEENVIEAKLTKEINLPCNKVIFSGDKVVLEKENNTYIIKKLIKRKNILSRTKKDGSKLNDIGKTNYIAANIDIAVIVASKNNPPLHPRFIDRYLMITKNNNIPTIICINKCDLNGDIEDFINTYENLNIVVICTSTYLNKGIEDLKQCLKGKQAIFLGSSGVGKSSLINLLMNSDDIKTGSISDKSKRGCHTTTKSKYYVWDKDSTVIDTPGIRGLDVSSFNPLEIQDYFKDFDEYKGECKYSDCLHYNEPIESCSVKRAVKCKSINNDRYLSYKRIIESIIK